MSEPRSRCLDCRDVRPRSESHCARILPWYSDRAGQTCGGQLRPMECGEHRYGAHIDYWHGEECTVTPPPRIHT